MFERNTTPRRYLAVRAALVAATLLASTLTAAAGGSPAKCQGGKNLLAGKYAACLAKAESTVLLDGDLDAYMAAGTRCASTFTTKWNSLEASTQGVPGGAGGCPTTGDESMVRTLVGRYNELLGLWMSASWLSDNGDGTITDVWNGLLWEKKDDAGGIHDVDNRYSWGSITAPYEPDGTAFTQFLGTLNGMRGEPCFAGYCDWRLPSRGELEVWFAAAQPAPRIDPAFKEPCTPGCASESCSCMADGAFYWTSTTWGTDPRGAHDVYFETGGTNHADYKTAMNAVRAVRRLR